MTVTFSEAVVGVPSTTNVTITGGNGSNNDSVTFSNIAGIGSLGRTDYISGNGSTASFNNGVVSQPTASQIKVTLTNACTGACGSLTTAGGTGSYVFNPVSGITDAADNLAVGPVAGSFTIRLF